MRRFVIAIIILGILFAACFIPVVKHSETTIEASIIDVSLQLNNAEKWKLWHIPLTQAFRAEPSGYVVQNQDSENRFTITTPQLSYSIANPIAGNFEIEVLHKKKRWNCQLSLSVLPQTNFTKLEAETKTRLINAIFSSDNEEIGKKIGKHLKEFMETPGLYYGFPIQIKPVVDSNVAVLKKTVSSDEKFTSLPRLLKHLEQYVSKHKLQVLQPPMLQFQQPGKDSLAIVMMLALNKPGPDENGIKCSKMPANGRMLVGRFSGKFVDRTQLAAAMDKFIFDKNLENLATNYEKYYSRPLPVNEASEVDMEMYYPIL
jgi:hypothetical protein